MEMCSLSYLNEKKKDNYLCFEELNDNEQNNNALQVCMPM